MRTAMAGPMSTGLSQVIFDMGLGSSCNHPLLEKLPSYTEGSRRKLISIDFASLAVDGGKFAVFGLMDFGVNVVPAIHPSCSDLRQKASKSAPGCCFFQYPCRIS